MELGKKIERVAVIDRSWVKPHLRARLESAEKARQPMSFTPPPGYLEWDPKMPAADNARLGAKGMPTRSSESPANRFNLYPGDVVRVVYKDYHGVVGELQVFQEISSAGRAMCLAPNGKRRKWNCIDSIQLVARKGEWINWEAGDNPACPIAGGIEIQVQLGDGLHEERRATQFVWEAHSAVDDIVKFRLI